MNRFKNVPTPSTSPINASRISEPCALQSGLVSMAVRFTIGIQKQTEKGKRDSDTEKGETHTHAYTHTQKRGHKHTNKHAHTKVKRVGMDPPYRSGEKPTDASGLARLQVVQTCQSAQ